MAKFKEIVVTKKESILTITLNNPDKRNVLSPTMLNELRDTLLSFSSDTDTRCVVVRGAGGKAFSSGYDIKALKDDDMMREFGSGHPLEECFSAIDDFPYPVIAMMNGHTFGAALELAVTCDLRVCVDTAQIGIPPAKLGVVYSFSGTKKFLNLIGPAYTKELFLRGHIIDASRAEKMGLVNYVVKESLVEEFTYKLAIEISENAPLSLSTMKKLIHIWQRNQNISAEDEMLIKSMFEKVQDSVDYKEGQKAFEEKRKPQFKGK